MVRLTAAIELGVDDVAALHLPYSDSLQLHHNSTNSVSSSSDSQFHTYPYSTEDCQDELDGLMVTAVETCCHTSTTVPDRRRDGAVLP